MYDSGIMLALVSDLQLLDHPLAREIFLRFSFKVKILIIFFGHIMASEVKGHLNKVVDNPVKCMYKNFRKNIMTGS